jgi:iron complex transport system permease protein
VSARVVVRAERVGVAVRVAPRALFVGLVLTVLAAGGLVLGVAEGTFDVPVGEVVATLLGGGDSSAQFIVLDLRLPRALTAVLVGLALGMSGAIFQDLSRNALVSPDVVGVTAGAGLTAVAVIVLGGSSATVPLAALAGAAATAAALYALAWRGGLQGTRLVLIGIGLTAMLAAATNYLLTRGELTDVQRATVWLVGSVYNRGWEHVVPLAISLVVLVPAALLLTRGLEALQLGDDVARMLGVRVERTRALLVLVAVALAAGAVAAAGPVGFVAFIAPHLVRRLVPGAGPGTVLPLAGLAGAALVVVCDTGARLVLAPTELPVGILTTVLAAPYFLVLLQRANRLGATG